jgi:CBS domain-containing protein
MTNGCPWCGEENISGVDVCEACGQPLDDPHLADPATPVEMALLNDRIQVLEPRPVVTIRSDATVDQALKLLADNRIGCVLIEDDRRLKGIFSERDALYRIGVNIDQVRHRPVAEFMTPNVQTLDPRAKVAYAVQLMDQGHYRHVPITGDDGSVTVIISVRDILAYLTDRMTRTE